MKTDQAVIILSDLFPAQAKYLEPHTMSVKLGKRFARISERKANIRMNLAKSFGIFKSTNAWLRLNKEFVHDLDWLFFFECAGSKSRCISKGMWG